MRHFVTLIEIPVHLIRVNPGHTYYINDSREVSLLLFRGKGRISPRLPAQKDEFYSVFEFRRLVSTD